MRSAARRHLSELPPTDLPVEEILDVLRRALISRRAAVLVAPPGAGKTTLVPLRLLDEPWLAGRRIVMLEPRRLAARAAARRMAASLGESVGDTVGYQTRDERRIGSNTRIEVVTEGILTRRLQHDPGLDGVGLVIFDEVHERNVPTDLGLAFLLSSRDVFGTDVAILAMSATAAIDSFARVLASDGVPAPVVRSEGRMFDVEIRHAPRRRDDRIESATAATVALALRETTGDVLVFLPGLGEIDRTRTALGGVIPPDVAVVRLAGALSSEEQDEALAGRPDGGRRVVLSTDIAETSLTVDGIRVVVDAGMARVPRLDPRTGLTELVTVTSSRASADQRSGRAGRVAPGVAYRMWSKIEDATRLAHLPAEITQVDLCGVLLEVAAWGTPLNRLDLIDKPPQRAIDGADETLRRLHLLDADGAITGLGREALSVPVHPRLAAMVVLARASGDARRAWLACVIAALLEERDVLSGRPSELPTDVALRAAAVLEVSRDHTLPVHHGVRGRVARSARDIARRLDMTPVDLDTDDLADLCGGLLLTAYPDRLAMRRTSPGQFVLRTGNGSWMDKNDPLAREEFVVAADLDGGRGNSRIRRAAGLGIDDVADALGDDLIEERTLLWDKGRDDLVQRVVRRVDALRLDDRSMPAPPGEATRGALLDRIATTRLALLDWTDTARATQHRIAFMRHHRGGDWPDLGDDALLADLERHFAPYLAGCTSRDDVRRIDIEMVLRSQVTWDQSTELDEMAPAMFIPPRGRPTPIDYGDPDAPRIEVRVQHLFGLATHPAVLGGRVPLTVVLLSPADRPIQVTADVPGFWRGSWTDVRKEMAGRYPKHEWPVDPTTR